MDNNKKCPRCGKQVFDGKRYCRECSGSELVKEDEDKFDRLGSGKKGWEHYGVLER